MQASTALMTSISAIAIAAAPRSAAAADIEKRQACPVLACTNVASPRASGPSLLTISSSLLPAMSPLHGLVVVAPSKGRAVNWARVFERTCKHHDDGHMAKLIRAVKPAGVVSKPVDHLPEFRVKQHMFLLAAVAAIDLSSDVPMIGIQHFDLVRGAGYYSSNNNQINSISNSMWGAALQMTRIVHVLFRTLIDALAPDAGKPKYWRLNISKEIMKKVKEFIVCEKEVEVKMDDADEAARKAMIDAANEYIKVND
ncbi:Oxidoreductase AflY [Botryosphaeria dothidea]|uniref:Oxidoreductase AflY n=1 Tax=Botryosphaeria dothidea TaxID=55169 RepID=A0A8H4J113_9PEZI|nr:Oxidoreductase AflY [Botryosphaeria dothidea]